MISQGFEFLKKVFCSCMKPTDQKLENLMQTSCSAFEVLPLYCFCSYIWSTPLLFVKKRFSIINISNCRMKNVRTKVRPEKKQEDVRMWFLSLDMAATASSWERNSTSASPVDLPLGATSMWTLNGFNGEKN